MGNGSYWNGSEWSSVQVDSPFDKSRVFVQSLPPAEPTPMRTGDLFIDTDTRKVQFRNGTSWTDISAGLETINIGDVVGLSGALDLKAPLASPTFTGTVSGITKAMVGLGNVDNTSDASKPVSTAQQTALDLKANLASPTFTGTVGGITKSMVGLANVDNTTDLSKPISTETQNALDGKSATGHTHVKANITDFAHTHVITDIPAITATAAEINVLDGILPTVTELNYVDGVTSNIQTQLNGKQASGSYAAASHTHTVSQVTNFAPTISGTLAGNNYYEKYADGQLICRGASTFATGSQSYTWTFPVAFVGELPQIITNHSTTAPESLASSHSSLALSSVIIEHNRSTSGSTTLYYSAIGRWK